MIVGMPAVTQKWPERGIACEMAMIGKRSRVGAERGVRQRLRPRTGREGMTSRRKRMSGRRADVGKVRRRITTRVERGRSSKVGRV